MFIILYNLRMQLHLSNYHPRHADILTAASAYKLNHLTFMFHKQGKTCGLKAAIKARGMKCIADLLIFCSQWIKQQSSRITAVNGQHTFGLNASGKMNSEVEKLALNCVLYTHLNLMNKAAVLKPYPTHLITHSMTQRN